jgi:prophage regulatory protein
MTNDTKLNDDTKFFLKVSEVSALTRRSIASIYRDMRAGRFPLSVELGANSVGWTRAAIFEWMATRPVRQS